MKGDYGSGRAVTGRIMAQTKNRKGYHTVHLSKGGFDKRISVHRIVAITFIPNDENKEQVNHKDGNKDNNAVENLEWVTNLENMRHAFSNGLANIGPCLRAAHTKETREKVRKSLQRKVVRSDGIVFESVNDAAKSVGVCHSAISMNIHGQTKTCQGYVFRFLHEGASVAKIAKSE